MLEKRLVGRVIEALKITWRAQGNLINILEMEIILGELYRHMRQKVALGPLFLRLKLPPSDESGTRWLAQSRNEYFQFCDFYDIMNTCNRMNYCC
jgi:hypothetical protein